MDRTSASVLFLAVERWLEAAWRWTSTSLAGGLGLTPMQGALAQFAFAAMAFLVARDVVFRVARGRMWRAVDDQINVVMPTISENATSLGAKGFDVRYSHDVPKVFVTFEFGDFYVRTEAVGRNHTGAALDAMRRAVRMSVDERARRRDGGNDGDERVRTERAKAPLAPKAKERFHADSPWWVVLGVPQGSTRREVTAAYRTLAKKHHPDVSGRDDVMVHLARARRESGP